MGLLHKLIAITLLAIFSLPFTSALLAMTPKSEASVPMCCHKNGKHHCMAEHISMSSDQPQFAILEEKCPHSPGVLTLGHQANAFGVPAAQTEFIGMLGQSAVIAQTESKRRISRDRSRQKRGPPSSLSSLLS